MRTALKDVKGYKTYTSTFKKFSISKAGNTKTMLLLNVESSDNFITDHVWVSLNEFKRKGFFFYLKRNIKKGNKMQFTAKVKEYLKRDAEGNIVKDYCFTNVSDIKIL